MAAEWAGRGSQCYRHLQRRWACYDTVRVRTTMHCQGSVYREKLAAVVGGQTASRGMGRRAKRTALVRGRRKADCGSDGQEEGIRAAEIRGMHESSGCNHGTNAAAGVEAPSERVFQAWPEQGRRRWQRSISTELTTGEEDEDGLPWIDDRRHLRPRSTWRVNPFFTPVFP